MPLLNPNRTQSPFSAPQRRRILPTSSQQTGESTNTLRLYPLDSTGSSSSADRRITPVSPLNHSQQWRMPPKPHPPRMQAHMQQQAQHMQQTPGMWPTSPPPQAQPATVPRGPVPPMQHNATRHNVTQHNTTQSRVHNMSGEAITDQQQAVTQFRRANQGLPDGVRYEPLDDTTMRLLRENGHLPPIESTPTNESISQIPSPQLPSVPQDMQAQQTPPMPQSATAKEYQEAISTIEGLIQDERNAQVFYSHLAKSTEIKIVEAALTDIANDSSTHTRQLTKILANQYKTGFVPVEAEINTNLTIHDALALALSEENRSLRVLLNLLEGTEDPVSEKTLQLVINKKIVNYNQLVRLHSNMYSQ